MFESTESTGVGLLFTSKQQVLQPCTRATKLPQLQSHRCLFLTKGSTNVSYITVTRHNVMEFGRGPMITESGGIDRLNPMTRVRRICQDWCCTSLLHSPFIQSAGLDSPSSRMVGARLSSNSWLDLGRGHSDVWAPPLSQPPLLRGHCRSRVKPRSPKDLRVSSRACACLFYYSPIVSSLLRSTPFPDTADPWEEVVGSSRWSQPRKQLRRGRAEMYREGE